MRGFRSSKALVDANVLFWLGQVGVADVEGRRRRGRSGRLARISRMCSGVVMSFCRFSMRMRTPRGWAKALRCSMAVREFSRARVFQSLALLAEVEDAGVDGYLLGGLEGALDLVHCGNAVGFLRGRWRLMVGGDVARVLSHSPGRSGREAGGVWRRRRCCGTTWRCRGRPRGRCSRSGSRRRRSRWFVRRRCAGRRAGRGAGAAGGRRRVERAGRITFLIKPQGEARVRSPA